MGLPLLYFLNKCLLLTTFKMTDECLCVFILRATSGNSQRGEADVLDVAWQ